jgi:hypothetical protein
MLCQNLKLNIIELKIIYLFHFPHLKPNIGD